MRASLICVTTIVFYGLSIETACGAGTYVRTEYPPSTAEGELRLGVTYTLWLPDGVETVRGIIVHQHGAGTTAAREGSTAAYDLHWQALAKKWDCALLGPSYHVLHDKNDISPGGSELWFDPRRGSDKAFLKALDDLAAKSGHAELASVPWCLWGHSGGGIWSDVMATLHPDRVVAIWMRSGAAIMFLSHPEFARPKVPAAMYSIPMMCNTGVKEKPAWMNEPGGGDKLTPEEKLKGPWPGTLATFKDYRARGAPIGFAPDPRTGHECGDSRYLAIPFLDACLAMRLPDKGSKVQTLKPVDMTKAWLAPLLGTGNDAQPAAMYKSDPKEAVWLPNEAFARAWMEYVKTGAVSDATPPPAPTNVRVSSRENGVEITWDAEADFESGIRSFLVLRDGKELAQVPKTPAGKFGRPLFQSMTYHDTPSKPLPEMKYVDADAKPGVRHTYSVISVNSVGLKSQPSAMPFAGEKSTWHDGFERHDFVMDEQTLAITPFKAPAGEKFGVKDPPKGQRRCIVIVPKTPAAGNPWTWRGCYWDHQPQAEVELLKRGFHVAYISANATLRPGKQWDAWYTFLTEHGLAKKPAFIGMSRGGEFAYSWACANPDKVSCIYADNTGGNRDLLSKIGALANNDVPLLHVNGSIDPLLGKYSTAIEGIYQQMGGRISVMIKEGAGHHPHSLRDPMPIVDFIVQSAQPTSTSRPDYLGGRITKTNFYSIENSYRDFPKEGMHITCRGPLFTECYDRYEFDVAGVEGFVTVIVPKTAAKDKPWVYRAGFVDRDAHIDLAMLAKGYHIVVGPVPYNADGPNLQHWNAVYKHLVSHGFAKKPALEGSGRAAGEVYAWAIENPDKVSCIYAQNPLMGSHMSKKPLLDNLAPLAKAGIPLLHICGGLDPGLKNNTLVVEKRYKELGGQITVIIKEGEGRAPLAPKDRQPVVDFIVNNVP